MSNLSPNFITFIIIAILTFCAMFSKSIFIIPILLILAFGCIASYFFDKDLLTINADNTKLESNDVTSDIHPSYPLTCGTNYPDLAVNGQIHFLELNDGTFNVYQFCEDIQKWELIKDCSSKLEEI